MVFFCEMVQIYVCYLKSCAVNRVSEFVDFLSLSPVYQVQISRTGKLKQNSIKKGMSSFTIQIF